LISISRISASDSIQLSLSSPKSTDTAWASKCQSDYNGTCDASRAIMNIADVSVTDSWITNEPYPCTWIFSGTPSYTVDIAGGLSNVTSISILSDN
jgi:hypothetical protein